MRLPKRRRAFQKAIHRVANSPVVGALPKLLWVGTSCMFQLYASSIERPGGDIGSVLERLDMDYESPSDAMISGDA